MSDTLVPGFEGDANDSVKLVLKKLDDTTMIVHVTGYIDTYNTPHFSKEMRRVIETGYVNLVISCQGLNYMSSTGIGAFTTLLKEVKHQRGSIKLANIQPKVFEVFQLLGFSQFFDMVDNLDVFIEDFGSVEEVPVVKVKPIFPKALKCPVCDKKLRTSKPGRFRCPECRSIITVDRQGVVKVG